ncbi:MAG: hypothetical protein HY719_11875 [Planctomycetes bacterium]|nr:hypothetical protein [Planctomycetota bacterium]
MEERSQAALRRRAARHSRFGIISVLFGNLAMLLLVTHLWTGSRLLDAWFVVTLLGFCCGFFSLLVENRERPEVDQTTNFAGMVLNIVPLVVYVALRFAGERLVA